MKHFRVAALVAALTWLASTASPAQTPASTAKLEIPDWAIPGTATHKQGPPPPDCPAARGETLSVEEFVRLANALAAHAE